MAKNRRVFGYAEAVFNTVYLGIGLWVGALCLARGGSLQTLVGIMALVLAGGDAFHLVPRILVVRTGREEPFRTALGLGKLITSITMTGFYLLLWQLGQLLFQPQGMGLWTNLLYALAAVRILLCLLPQNRWTDRHQPVSWGVYRNLPFFLMGAMVGGLFWWHRAAVPAVSPLWAAILLSFAFYLPVVLWVNKNPKLGMLMLPKTCAYLWILILCMGL